jgi:hypothetical protein
MSINSEVAAIHEILLRIRKQHDDAAAPWLARLAAIESMRPPPPILISAEQARALGFLPPDVFDKEIAVQPGAGIVAHTS